MSHYTMERGWQDHPLFEGDEYSRRDAWEWLIAHAAWQDKRARVNGHMVELKRGQLSYSYRFLAEKWLWSLGKVQRFLADLKNDTMIDTVSDTGQIIITIQNYDRFQSKPSKSDTPKDTQADTVAIQERYKEEEGKEYISSEAKASSDILPSAVEPLPAPRAKPANAIVFDFESSTWHGITEKKRLGWIAAFPAIRLDTELAKAGQWLIANPANRKTNYAKFLFNWFCKAQDSAVRVREGPSLYRMQKPEPPPKSNVTSL